MSYKLSFVAVAAFAALSACSGSGSDTISGGVSSADAQAVATTYADYQSRIDGGTLTKTSPTGEATMSGYMGIGNVDDQDSTTTVLGKMSLAVNFDGGTVSGKASDFAVYNGDPLEKKDGVTGELAIAGTVSGSDMNATATGTMADSSSNPTDFNLAMTGSFYDDGGKLTTVGDVTGSMTEGSDVNNNLTGGFYATKD